MFDSSERGKQKRLEQLGCLERRRQGEGSQGP